MPILEKLVLKSMILVSTFIKKTQTSWCKQSLKQAQGRKETKIRVQSINQLKRKQKNRNKIKPKADL